jgi:type I restriction enzyme S subunit
MGSATDFLCEAGTTIIGRKGSINSPIFVDQRFWNVDTAFGLSPGPGLDSRFLYRFCESYDFSRHNKGTALPSLVKSDLLEITIPLPPLVEQKRVAAVLDEVFIGVAAARANCERNLRNSQVLFRACLESVFAGPSTGWDTWALGEVCTVEYGTRVVRKRDGGSAYPVYGGGGPTFAMDTFNRADRLVVGRFGMSEQCTRLVAGKFFLNDSGLTLAPKNPEQVSQAFLDKWTLSANDRIFALGRGTAQKNLDAPAFRCARVPVPPAAEQAHIVEMLDNLWGETQRFALICQRKLAALDELKKSLLHEAFSGNL